MAPELRKRKSKDTVTAEPKAATKQESPSAKRKATEEVSSTKSAKKAKPALSTKTKKSKSNEDEQPRKREKAAKNKKKADGETALVVRDSADDDNKDMDDFIGFDDPDEPDDKTQQLVAELDAGDDTAQDAGFAPGQDVGKVPVPPSTNREKKTRKKAAAKAAALEASESRDAADGPGVVYVGRIPHGFYEHEMRQYFSQFGPVTRLRLSRNRKTGASKHFAFVEFASAATADIVARTMDNYLLFGHVLRCRLVEADRIHKDLWKGANQRFKRPPRAKMAAAQLRRPLTRDGWERRVRKEQGRRSRRAEKLKEMGYEFEAPEMLEVPPPLSPPPVEPAAEVSGGLIEAAETATTT